MEVTMNELNYWFHNDRAKRDSYMVLKSIELKFTSENGNCNKCSKFQLLSYSYLPNVSCFFNTSLCTSWL